jgi:hypothetical protein
VIENPEISLVGSGHFFTRVIRFNHISIGAISAGAPQAQNLPWHQIRAFRVDVGIQNCKLIATEGISGCSNYKVAYTRRDVLGRRNPIADITLLDGIRASTLLILSKNCQRLR